LPASEAYIERLEGLAIDWMPSSILKG
jgi:hypothetical protein